jgi:DNA recombination protein RmuC
MTALVVLLALVAGLALGVLVAGHLARSGAHRSDAASLDRATSEMRAELDRLGAAVGALGERNAQHFGRVDESLRAHAEVTRHLFTTTQSLREALANPKTRGQWGERMADDVLRLAGFVEHVNYEKQTSVAGESRVIPDFTFFMPKGHVLYMDVKFPLAAYLRYLDAGSDAERDAYLTQFLRDVRLRVRELARREYATAGDRPAVDQVLLFLPNETVSAFLFEHDPDLLDDAMRQRVVLCSPVSLFAMLGLIRQAFDSFMVEQTSDQIVALLGRFDEQWVKYSDSLETVRRRFEAVQREFDQLVGTRKRALERPLRELEAVRRERGVAVADLAGDGMLDDDLRGDGPGGILRELGA